MRVIPSTGRRGYLLDAAMSATTSQMPMIIRILNEGELRRRPQWSYDGGEAAGRRSGRWAIMMADASELEWRARPGVELNLKRGSEWQQKGDSHSG